VSLCAYGSVFSLFFLVFHESAIFSAETHKEFTERNYVSPSFPQALKRLLVSDIVWDERRAATGKIYFTYPRDFVEIKQCGGRSRNGCADVIGEIEFVVEVVRTLCLVPGVAEVSPSLLYSNRETIGFLPTAFTVGGGIEMCPHKYIVSILDEFNKKRSAQLSKSGHFGLVFLCFVEKVTKATSHAKILSICEKMYPKQLPPVEEEPPLPDDENLAKRFAQVSPAESARFVQILEDSGAHISRSDDDLVEAVIDMADISIAGKRALDKALPPPVFEMVVPTQPSAEEEAQGSVTPSEDEESSRKRPIEEAEENPETPSYIVDSDIDGDLLSVSFDTEKRQRVDHNIGEFEDLDNLTGSAKLANIRITSNTAYETLATVLEGFEKTKVAMQSVESQMAALLEKQKLLGVEYLEKQRACVVNKTKITKMLDDVPEKLVEKMTAVAASLENDAKHIFALKHQLESTEEMLASLRSTTLKLEEQRDDLSWKYTESMKTIKKCAKDVKDCF